MTNALHNVVRNVLRNVLCHTPCHARYVTPPTSRHVTVCTYVLLVVSVVIFSFKETYVPRANAPRKPEERR